MEAYGNIYVTDDTVAIRAGWEPGDRPPVLSRNIYHSLTAGAAMEFAGGTFAEWQEKGQDQGSVLVAPGFADAAARDFSLTPDAPACQAIGFVPFTDEIRKAGLYGDNSWTSLPSRHTPREPSPVWSPDDLARLIAFEMDFEDMPEGYEPSSFRLVKEGDATFAVHPSAGRGGGMGYRCTDRAGLRKPFYPYITVAPKRLAAGTVRFALDFRQPEAAAAGCTIEFRGSGFTSDVGPSMAISASGEVVANDIEVGVIPPGTWLRLEWRVVLGDAGDGTYALTAQWDEDRRELSLPFRHDTFRDLRWLGIVADGDADGSFHLDNLVLEVN